MGACPIPTPNCPNWRRPGLPTLDALASESACGLTVPVMPGVAPGSGPGHLALFGYEPTEYLIGRGALEGLGIEVDLREGDVCARGNFCTVDAQGNLVDRRAGRVPSEVTIPLCAELDKIEMDGVDLRVYPVEGYRFVLHLRGEGLSESVSETDPQRIGVPDVEAYALEANAEKTATIVRGFVSQARSVLSNEERANMVLLRGFSSLPHLPSMGDAFGR